MRLGLELGLGLGVRLMARLRLRAELRLMSRPRGWLRVKPRLCLRHKVSSRLRFMGSVRL